MVTTNSTMYLFEGQEYPINTKGGECYCYCKILDNGINELNKMLKRHCKVLVIRLDIHMEELTKLNTDIGYLMDFMKRFIQREYSTRDVGYIWAREIEKAKKQHYHLCIYVDGSKVRSSFKIVDWVEQFLKAKQMSYYRPENTYMMVHRNNKESIDTVVYRMSYLAKVRGKGYVEKHVRNYSSSRLT